MKTLHYKIKLAAGVLAVAALMVSCLPKTQTMGDAGQTLIKLMPDGFTVVAVDAIATEQQAIMFEVRRDVHSESALNSSTTVILQKDDALLVEYNNENETELEPLPVSLGTTIPPAAADGKVTLEFGSGEFVKSFKVKIPDATKFDFAKQYALAYKLVSSSGTGKISEAVGKEVIVQVMVKNKYDGIYEVTAVSPMLDVVNSALVGYYPFKYKLVTTGANTVDCIEFDNDYPLHPIWNSSSGAWSYYGAFCPRLVFSSTGDGTIIAANNYWGVDAGSNKRDCVLDPSGINKWDPSTKTIRIKYIMVQKANTTLPPPYYRTYFDEKWTYKGPR